VALAGVGKFVCDIFAVVDHVVLNDASDVNKSDVIVDTEGWEDIDDVAVDTEGGEDIDDVTVDTEAQENIDDVTVDVLTKVLFFVSKVSVWSSGTDVISGLSLKFRGAILEAKETSCLTSHNGQSLKFGSYPRRKTDQVYASQCHTLVFRCGYFDGRLRLTLMIRVSVNDYIIHDDAPEAETFRDIWVTRSQDHLTLCVHTWVYAACVLYACVCL